MRNKETSLDTHRIAPVSDIEKTRAAFILLNMTIDSNVMAAGYLTKIPLHLALYNDLQAALRFADIFKEGAKLTIFSEEITTKIDNIYTSMPSADYRMNMVEFCIQVLYGQTTFETGLDEMLATLKKDIADDQGGTPAIILRDFSKRFQ